jgi:trehalose 6-phosphate phosphatase
MVTEFTPPGADKGAALHAVMRLPAFLNRRPLYFGDDLADEAAFRVARHLGGAGVLVGHHGHPTSASCVLATPRDLHRRIASVLMGVEGRRAGANATRCR